MSVYRKDFSFLFSTLFCYMDCTVIYLICSLWVTIKLFPAFLLLETVLQKLIGICDFTCMKGVFVLILIDIAKLPSVRSVKIFTPPRNIWESLTLWHCQHNMLFNFCTKANLICENCCLIRISLFYK